MQTNGVQEYSDLNKYILCSVIKKDIKMIYNQTSLVKYFNTLEAGYTFITWGYVCCPTWHDDIREAQFPGDGYTPGEEDHVFSSQLLYVPVEELESHC